MSAALSVLAACLVFLAAVSLGQYLWRRTPVKDPADPSLSSYQRGKAIGANLQREGVRYMVRFAWGCVAVSTLVVLAVAIRRLTH
jgi:hypothetical protein